MAIKAADYNLTNQASVDMQRYNDASAKRTFRSKYAKKMKTLHELDPKNLKSSV